MHEVELREVVQCLVCRRKVGETGLPILWRIQAERHILDLNAISRQQGLTMTLGGNAAVARVMGTDPPMTNMVMTKRVGLCDTCAIERLPELLGEEREQPANIEEGVTDDDL